MLKGTLDDFDLRHILRFVALAQKTGKLSVGGPSGGGKIFFRAGDIYHAESDLPRQGFGRKLVNAGKLTEVQLRQTLEYCATEGKNLGEALVSNGLISRADLEAALRQEIEEVAAGLFRNESGRFLFEIDEQVESDTVILVPVESLIEEDPGALGRAVPSLNPEFVKASISADDNVEISVTSEEWSVIALVDGRRSIEDIAARLGRNDHAVLRSLRRLMSIGLVRLAGTRPPRGEPDPVEPLGDEVASRSERHTPPPPPPPTTIDLRDDERLWSEGRR
jgi:Domain of unknown function (DUF4388)